MSEIETNLILSAEDQPDFNLSEPTLPQVTELIELPNLLTRVKENINSQPKVVDLKEDIRESDSKSRTALSGAGVIGLFATGPLKLGTIIPLSASMEVLQTSRPGIGGIAAGVVAGLAGGASYGAVVRGGSQVIKNGVEHFPKLFGLREETPETRLDQADKPSKSQAVLSDISLGVKCNMMSNALMLAETTQGRTKAELSRYSNRLSRAGALVMVAASTAVAESIVVSGHPELAGEIQDKIHDPKYLGSLTVLLFAIDGVNYIRRNGLSFIRDKWLNKTPSAASV